jgi:adenosylmethionine-8-amino-7-oxononanoate transaminase
VSAEERAELARREKACLWHPFTQMRDWEADEPFFVASGEGVRLRDLDGREYYDGNSSLWVNVHGHRHPQIDAAIVEQLGRIAHSTLLGLTHQPAVELAERLIRVAPPGLSRVFYSDSGSTAVEVALKMGFQYWRHRGETRPRFIALEESYHGDTLGGVSVGGMPLFHGIFEPLLFTVHFAPCPARAGSLDAAATGVEQLLRERSGEVAAIIVEPLVQAAAGMLLSPSGFLRRLRELCDRYNTLLIVDEVATGFGRTGKLFGCEHEAVSPDLMCVAKGLTGGYLPLAATLAAERIYQAFLGEYGEFKTFFHGHSYTGNPLACAAAIASLELFEREGVLEALPGKIDRVRELLAPIAALPQVREVRQRGLMVGIELCRPDGSAYPATEPAGARVCRRARDLGLITRPLGNVVVFLPPLASTLDDLGAMLDILHRSIASPSND